MANLSESRAREWVQALARRGVKEFVVCSGSRNSPLTLALVAAEDVEVWHHYEERSAAFFALGRARAIAGPVAVVTTSGTAAAELLPAAIEAHYAAIPLVLLTADRPSAFRGTGAPQAIEQAGLFSGYVETALDTGTAEPSSGSPDLDAWTARGSLHLNLCLEEPLLSEAEMMPWQASEGRVPTWTRRPSDPRVWEAAGDAVVEFLEPVEHSGPVLAVVGGLAPSARSPVKRLLRGLEVAVLADAASGLRSESGLQDQLLRGGEVPGLVNGFGGVLRLGSVPSFRLWRDLEEAVETPVLSLCEEGFPGLARGKGVRTFKVSLEEIDPLLDRVSAGGVDPASVFKEDRVRAQMLDETIRLLPSSEVALMRRLSQVVGASDRVYLGNSLPIREWNFAARYQDGASDVWASRGANGIDGQVSTFLGLSGGAEPATTAWGIFGDLTALYDLAGPWMAAACGGDGIRRRIVVVNNGGGRIFSRLPVMKAVGARAREVTENEHPFGFEGWASLWNVPYWSWSPDSESWWDDPDTPFAVIEIRPDQEASRQFWATWEEGLALRVNG